MISSKNVYEGRLITLSVTQTVLPNGHQMTVEAVQHPGAAAVVAVEDGSVVLIRQFRPVINDFLLELPAGKLDVGEDSITAAKRELLEEVGLAAKSLQPLTTVLSAPGYSTERVAIFLCTETVATLTPRPHAHEVLSVVRLPLASAVALVRSGEISDAKTAIGLLLAESVLGASHP
jgi:ADP-ribose pyrophosphatase